MKLREIMTAPVLTVRSDEPASDALARMRDAGVRHAVVVSGAAGDAIEGVVSERDLGGPYGGTVRRRRTVSELMQRDVVSASPELRATEAVLLVRRHRVGCIPVVDDDALVGIVTRSDLLDALAGLRRRGRRGVRAGARGRADDQRPPMLVSPNRDKWP